MRVLAVDTSSERGSVCVMDGHERSECEPDKAKRVIEVRSECEPDKAKRVIEVRSECEPDRAKPVIEVLGEVRIASSIQYSERLFRSIEFLFHYLPFRLSDIDVFAAACGPGSFTGLRVGLAAMEGFVAAQGKRGAGVTTLQALAWKTGIHDSLIAPMIDARRGDIYGALYRHIRNTDTLVEEVSPAVLKPAQWLSSLPRVPLVFCGDGANRYRSMIEDEPDWTIHPMDLYLASTIAELAMTSNSGPLAPVYLRKTDAEIARESIGSPSS